MAMASCLPFIARGLVYPLAYFHRSFKFLQTRQVMEIGSTVSYSSAVYNYEAAVETLNSLQSNAAVLEKARLQKDRQAVGNVPFTEKYLNRIGISMKVLDKLNVIHVSGTKGKGSTCAFCDSILIQHGLKTGFYSSPHLIEVRERIRINGKPLPKDKFAKYFWQVYSMLKQDKDDNHDMPAYFKFLTIMAFHVFIKEEVDVAILEVGIGGLYDCTNVIRKPAVVGITSLGLDHVSLLGDTVEKIASHKAGIMKAGVPAYTVPDQPGDSLQVLVHQAKEIQCPLYVAPSLEEYQWAPYQMNLGLPGHVQFKNASLALQLCRSFLYPRINKEPNERIAVASPFQITLLEALGLAKAFWPGRSQILHFKNVSYYIDGAHTPESIAACVEWFQQSSQFSRNRKRVLIFNTTGDRNTSSLLIPLKDCHFDEAIFCPNIVDATQSTPKDLLNLMVTKEQQISRCNSNRNAWIEINGLKDSTVNCDQVFSAVPTINEALARILELTATSKPLDVLVTGSLHLVGGVLSLLDPELEFLSSDEKKNEPSVLPYCEFKMKVNGCCTVPGTP